MLLDLTTMRCSPKAGDNNAANCHAKKKLRDAKSAAQDKRGEDGKVILRVYEAHG